MSSISPINPGISSNIEAKSQVNAYSPIGDVDFISSLSQLNKGVSMITAQETQTGMLNLSGQRQEEVKELKGIKDYQEDDMENHLQKIVDMITKMTKESKA